MVDALLGKVLRARSSAERGGDAALKARADRLADRYLDGVRASSVRWSRRMQHRWGSCTPATREIRISDRLAAVPDLVLDYVLVHELAHLHVRGHQAPFHALVARYPHTERARGYLEGLQAGLGTAARDLTATSAQAPGDGPPSPASSSGSSSSRSPSERS